MVTQGVHLHVHSEESELDGKNSIEQLVIRAKEMGFPAIAITDHGVASGIPALLTYSKKHNIKAIPGCEIYTTEDHTIQSEELKKIREKIMLDLGMYKIQKDKIVYDVKAFNEIISKLKKNHWNFNELDAEITLILEKGIMNGDINTVEPFLEFENVINDFLKLSTFHQVVLAKNNEGLSNLYQIISEANINGFYRKPRISLKYIRENNLGKGLIATSGCLAGVIPKMILADRIDEAIDYIKECKETFEHFYLEKQATYIPDQLIVNEWIDKLAIQTNTKKILTNDVHYAKKEDYEHHNIVVAMGSGGCVENNKLVYPHEFWLKSNEEMLEGSNYDEEAWSNTLEIVDLIDISISDEPTFPKYIDVPGKTSKQLLQEKSWHGLFEYALTHHINLDVYKERLQEELDVILSTSFSDYFLIVSDYISWAKENGFSVGPGRGSSAGSLVAMCLKITSIDPIKFGLMFERFLSKDRISYPDIDSDFTEEGGLAIFGHLQELYGERNVAQVGTKLKMAAKSICRSVGKAMGYEIKQYNDFTAAIEAETLEESYKVSEKTREFAEKYPKWWAAMLDLEGMQRGVGVHAGGVVISPEPIDQLVPLRINERGLLTTGFDKYYIENYLVKFDILKVETLKLIEKTMEMANIKGVVDIDDINLNDPYVYENIYNQLNVSGVFQVESKGMQDTIQLIKPEKFTELVAIIALYRPGPMDFIPSYAARKNGKEPITYKFDSCKYILEETYGITIYQEQLMSLSVELGGLTKSQSDYIQRSVSKKQEDVLEKWVGYMIYGNKELNIEGALARGYKEADMLKLKEEWIKFGEYAFNKSHSVGYAKLSFQTAYLKAYYYIYFMAALISTNESKKEKNKEPKYLRYKDELKRNGVRVLGPDLIISKDYWTPFLYEKEFFDIDGTKYIGEIRYSLTLISGITTEKFNSIQKLNLDKVTCLQDFLQELEEQKKIRSDIKSEIKSLVALSETLSVTDPDNDELKEITKTLERLQSEFNKLGKISLSIGDIAKLIKSGAFDRYSKNRTGMLRELYLYDKDIEKANEYGESTTKKEIADYEIEVLGSVFSFETRFQSMKDGEVKQFTGDVINIQSWVSSKGKTHYYVTLELEVERIECTLWGFKMDRMKTPLNIGDRVTVKGEKGFNRLTIESIKVKGD